MAKKAEQKKKYLNRILPALFLFVFLLISLFLAILAAKQKRDDRGRASASSVDLTINQPAQVFKQGDNITLNITVNTHLHKLTAAQLELTFDNTLFDYVSFTPGIALNEIIVPGIAFGNKIYLTLGTKPVLVNPGPPPVYEIHPFTGTAALAILKLKAKLNVAGTGQITFNPQTTSGTGTIILGLDSGNTNIVGDLIGTSLQIEASISPTPSLSKSPTPSCTLPAAVSGLQPSTIACTSSNPYPVTFKWNPVSEATSYYLRIDDTSNGWVTCGSGTPNPGDYCILDIASTFYSKSLPANKTYRWWVSAVNSCQTEGALSAKISLSIPGVTSSCPTPTPICPSPYPTPPKCQPGEQFYFTDCITICVTPTPSIYPVCTPVFCPYPASLDCPQGQECLGGCGKVCISPTPDPSITTTPTRTPTLTPTGISGKPGDANGDGIIDGIDYVAWLNHYNTHIAGAANGDFNNNGFVDGLDYVIWRNNYGK